MTDFRNPAALRAEIAALEAAEMLSTTDWRRLTTLARVLRRIER